MWHQARKQEKKLRCLMVDYKKRAERRRNYYELCKKDPCSFLRIQGSTLRIHIDPTVAAAAEGPRSMMAWNNDQDNLIDRFDVRAHLDHIPDYKPGSNFPDALEVEDDMRCNYDRYRIIVQNDCASITEEAALRQIEVDEKYGDVTKNVEQETKKKALAGKKAAIGFSYGDHDSSSSATNKKAAVAESSDEEEEGEDDFVDVDLDIAFDIDELNGELKQQLDVVATTYGMAIGEFAEQLTKDKEDEQELREAKIAEQEKAAMSGRKSRKERRVYKETMLRLRGASPPKYQRPDHAPRASPTYADRISRDAGSDSSRSPSPVGDSLEFITNLGEDDDTEYSIHSNTEDNLPPHLRVGATSSTASWKQRRRRSESPEHVLKNTEPTNQIVRKQLSPPPPIKRYRRASLEKSDKDSDLSSDEDKSSRNRRQHSYKLSADGNTKDVTSSSKAYAGPKSSSQSDGSKLTVQERLRRKMKSAINRTYKEDKRTLEEKKDQVRKEQRERAEEIRHQAEELRRRDFNKRHHSSSSSRSRSRSREKSIERRRRENSGARNDDRLGSTDYKSTSRGGYRPPHRDYDSMRHTERHINSRESRDRYRDSNRGSHISGYRDSNRGSHTSGHRHRSRSRSPARRGNYR